MVLHSPQLPELRYSKVIGVQGQRQSRWGHTIPPTPHEYALSKGLVRGIPLSLHAALLTMSLHVATRVVGGGIAIHWQSDSMTLHKVTSLVLDGV